MELAKAYVQIIPSAKGFSGSLEKAIGGDVANAGGEAGGLFGRNMVGSLVKVVAAAGIGIQIKKALDAGGALQQSFGGLDTIYGEASEAAKEYAKEAAKAGISMNDYAEQAVSFGASLKQSFGDDIQGAVEAANTAILDMADNSAKMGTPLENIQNAYQGFAKQNYTMLDNLKLGYGGTKKEMERLLADAERLSGVHYDMENLGDVYAAIHVIQGELGLTGVAAAEAEGTFTGSMGAMKASVENLFAALSTGGDVTEPLMIMVTSIKTFFLGNLVPMIANIIKAVPELAKAAIMAVASTDWGEVVSGLLSTFKEVLNAYSLEMLADTSIVDDIVTGIRTKLPFMIYTAGDVITGFVTGLLEKLPDVIDSATEIIGGLVNGIGAALPNVLNAAGDTLATFVGGVLEKLPDIYNSAAKLIATLIKGIADNLPKIMVAAANVMKKILVKFAEHLPQILRAGMNLIIELAAGIIRAIPKVVAAIPQVVKVIWDGFKSIDWIGLGGSIISGIISGIKSMGSALWDAITDIASSAFGAVKSFFGIASPSKLMRDEIGKWIPAGIAEGITENSNVVDTAMRDIASGTYDVGLFTDVRGAATSGGEVINYGGVTINVTADDVTQSRDFVDWLEGQLVARQNSRRAAALS